MDKILNNPIITLISSLKPESSEQKRLFFSLGLALLIHFIILSIHFSLPDMKKKTEQQLDIILTPSKNDAKTNKKADFLSQSNQQGGGTVDKKQRSSNVIPLIKQNSDLSKKPVQSRIVQSNFKKNESKSSLSSQKSSTFKSTSLKNKITARNKESLPEKKPIKTIDKNYLHRLKQKIVDLQADLDTQARVYSRLSKLKYINASTTKAKDAEYIKKWTKKIEYVGNINYPEEAKKQRLSGKLILAVTVSPSGKVLNISVRQSSNNEILDQAAINIVKLSEPFDPIPSHVLLDNNALVITRTWIFSRHKDGNLEMN